VSFIITNKIGFLLSRESCSRYSRQRSTPAVRKALYFVLATLDLASCMPVAMPFTGRLTMLSMMACLSG
jgi:hypothetical protein